MPDLARFFSPAKDRLAALGLDIGRHAIRLVELSRNKSGPLVLQRYASESLLEGVISDDGIADLEQVMTAAQRLWQLSGSKASRVAIGVPAAAVTLHRFSPDQPFAATPPPQLETLAKAAIAPLLDYRIEDASVDFCITTPTSPTSGQAQILVAATHKHHLEDRVAIAESLHLLAVVADADSYAAHAALARARCGRNAAVTTDQDAFVLLHLEKHEMQLSLPTDQHLLHIHSYSGEHLSAAATAEAAARELRTLQSLQPDRPIRQLIVAGSGASTPGLIAALQEHCKIAAVLADPFADMTFAAGIDALHLASVAPAYLVACGLALRNFD